jgi:hypothetical protein
MTHKSQSVVDIFNVFTLLEKELLNTTHTITGGVREQTTEPYKHFEDNMNEIYDYVKDVFETNEKNKKAYRDSVKNMDKNTDKNCNCDTYKADKNELMKPSINGAPVIFTLKDADRDDSPKKIKNEWIL